MHDTGWIAEKPVALAAGDYLIDAQIATDGRVRARIAMRLRHVTAGVDLLSATNSRLAGLCTMVEPGNVVLEHRCQTEEGERAQIDVSMRIQQVSASS